MSCCRYPKPRREIPFHVVKVLHQEHWGIISSHRIEGQVYPTGYICWGESSDGTIGGGMKVCPYCTVILPQHIHEMSFSNLRRRAEPADANVNGHNPEEEAYQVLVAGPTD